MNKIVVWYLFRIDDDDSCLLLCRALSTSVTVKVSISNMKIQLYYDIILCNTL